MITKNDAAKFWAKYFNADEEEALECHHMTIDCMVKFAQQQVKNCSIPDVVGRSEQLHCEHNYEPDTTCGVDITCCTRCGDII